MSSEPETMTAEQAVAHLEAFCAPAVAASDPAAAALPPFVKPIVLQALRVLLVRAALPPVVVDAIIAFVSDAIDNGLQDAAKAFVAKLLEFLNG